MKKPPVHKPNYFYTIVSVTLVLFLLGLFGLLVVQGQQMLTSLREQVEIIVELKEDSTPAQLDSLKLHLAQSAYFKPEFTKFINKDEGAKMMQEEFGQDFGKLDMANPLYDVLIFNVKSAWMQTDSMSWVREDLKTLSYVNDVFYKEDVTESIAANFNKIKYWVLGFGLFFIFVAVALILNTVRLALYANRFLIKNMELVGASWGFISKPYLRRSFRQGVLCSMLAIIGLTALLYFVFRNVPDMQSAINLPGVAIVFGALLVLGFLIMLASTYYVVKKYLRMRVDDMY
ncbi:MAG: permease-like cell division protein FtsX [Saprospiraceae bacterium]|jgi:cell division transport system permease protein|nr:permease-like cell division protein FtsX [Saprospiraceae bacterium]